MAKLCMKCLLAHDPEIGCNEAERTPIPLTEEQWWKWRKWRSLQVESTDLSTEKDYLSLRKVLDTAYAQAAYGKGKERHANSKPFEEQPMQALSDQIGSEAGLIFQACKKATEGLRMGDTERTIKEYLGAINYLAGAVIFLEKKAKTTQPTEAKNG